MKYKLSSGIFRDDNSCGYLCEVKHVEDLNITNPVFLQTFLKNSGPLIMP